MATSLLALIDDIASVLDDVAVLTKVAARKTAGVLGDDLAFKSPELGLPVLGEDIGDGAVSIDDDLVGVRVAGIEHLREATSRPRLTRGGRADEDDAHTRHSLSESPIGVSSTGPAWSADSETDSLEVRSSGGMLAR